MKGLLADCRHAVRLYAKTPGASIISVIVLGIATAFVCAFLSLYVDLVLRPHPGFADSGRLATIGQTGGTRLMGLPPSLVGKMSDEMASIDAAASSYPTQVLLGTDLEPVGIELVSEEFFGGLQPHLALGRGLEPAEHRADSEPVAVISHRLWQTRFGGRADVLETTFDITRDPGVPYSVMQTVEGIGGMTIVDGAPERPTTRFRVVGIMADSLPGLSQMQTEIWVSFERAFSLYVADNELQVVFNPALTIVRKRPGVSTGAVAGEIESRYAETDFYAGSTLRRDAIDGVARDIEVHRDANRQLRMFLAGSILLALAAAANVSLFLLARAPGRRRELGIRMSVGAPVRRLARQLASESGLLVLVSTLLGVFASVWLSAFLRSLALLRDAQWRNVTLLDWRVLAMAAVFIVILTALVSLAPIVGLKRAGIATSSRHLQSRASPAQRVAGTAQIAAAGALGAAAVAFGWHLGALMFGHPGYETADRYAVRFEIPQRLPDDAGPRASFDTARVRAIIESLPGVHAAAFASHVPGEEMSGYTRQIPTPSDPPTETEALIGVLDANTIEVLGLRLLHGRAPAEDEYNVAIVNQAFARLWWGRANVVGEPMPVSTSMSISEGDPVIGVLEDLSYEHPSATALPVIYGSSSRLSDYFSAIVIETSLTSATLEQELRRLEASGDLEIEIGEVRSLAAIRSDRIAPDRARGLLTITTAVLVVLISAVGFYATQRYLVAAGRREYAIRASLGAGPISLGRLVIRRGVLLGLPGLVLGGFLAFIAVAWLRDNYVSRDISPTLVLLWSVAGLMCLLLASSFGPAREARRTEPALLLRED